MWLIFTSDQLLNLKSFSIINIFKIIIFWLQKKSPWKCIHKLPHLHSFVRWLNFQSVYKCCLNWPKLEISAHLKIWKVSYIKNLVSPIFRVFLHHLLFPPHVPKIQWIFKMYLFHFQNVFISFKNHFLGQIGTTGWKAGVITLL